MEDRHTDKCTNRGNFLPCSPNNHRARQSFCAGREQSRSVVQRRPPSTTAIARYLQLATICGHVPLASLSRSGKPSSCHFSMIQETCRETAFMGAAGDTEQRKRAEPPRYHEHQKYHKHLDLRSHRVAPEGFIVLHFPQQQRQTKLHL